MKLAAIIAGAAEPDGFPAGAVRATESLPDEANLPNGMRWVTEGEVAALQTQFLESVTAWAASKKFQRKKDEVLLRIKTQLRDFIERHYSDAQQRTLAFQLQIALSSGDTAKAARISAASVWIASCVKAYHDLRPQVEQANTSEALDAIALDVAPLLATDPLVTLEEVL